MEIESYVLTAFQTNCFVLKDGDEAIVVDPGDAPGELLDALDGVKLRGIVLTHTHVDHCAGAAAVKERTGADIACHKDAVPMLAGVAEQAKRMGISASSPPEPDRFLDEGDKVSFGSVDLDVLYVPGHAPGHIALAGDGFVIAGDVLFAGSIGRTDFPGASHEQLITSIREKLLVLPDDTAVLSGHGPATTIGAERAMNPFLV